MGSSRKPTGALGSGAVTINPRDGSFLGTVRLDGWAGCWTIRVEIVRETAKRYRIRFLEPGPNRLAGYECYVAKNVVRLDEPEKGRGTKCESTS